MRTAVFLVTVVFYAVCEGQEVCEIFPRNPVIPYGSDLTLFLRTQPSGCLSKTPFRPSRVFWTLDERKIDKRFYNFNSTFTSVSIHNVSVERGKVECFLKDTPPVLLHYTFILTYPVLSSPTNVSCTGKMGKSSPWPKLTCMWDHDQYNTDVNYTVHFRQGKYYYSCPSKEKNCTFKDNELALLTTPLSIKVSAQNSYGYVAHSNEIIYSSGWEVVQMEPPDVVSVEPLPTGLRVTWRLEQREWINRAECEIRLHEKDSHTEIMVEHENCDAIGTENLTEVKPCTNYTVSVRSSHRGRVWSLWSRDVPVLSYVDVSSFTFRLWRSKSVLADRGSRTVLLMWKGIPPSCNAIDEYCISCDTLSFHKCFGPYENNMFITLDEHPHRITVAAFRNQTSLNEASVAVPGVEEELDLPPVKNISVFVQDGGIHITWKKPSLPVTGYLIIWNSTAQNHMWQQTLETSYTLKGDPSTLYTVSLIPLYHEGPGNETVLHNCNQERKLAKVFDVQVIRVSDKHAEIHWVPMLPSLCCAFVLNYTVFYRVANEPKIRNVTVGPNHHHVILEDLQAQTEYSVYVMARTVADSSESRTTIFSTKPSKAILIILITCSVGLVLFTLLAVTIQRKCLSKKIPDPRFSSLSMWPSDNCRKPWNLFSAGGGRDTEKILPCHVDSEVSSVSSMSERDITTVKALADIKNIITDEIISQPETAPLAASRSKEQKVYPLPLVDLHPPGICPHHPVQTLYRQQTPLSSPIESPSKPLWSDKTEVLLTPKLKNTAYFTSYVTLDMFEPKKQPTK